MGFWQFATGGGSGGGSGDVVGPASATDNAIARFDTGTGKLLQNSDLLISEPGIVANYTSVLQFGGSTSSFPGFSRVSTSGTEIRVVLADLSAFTTLRAGTLNVSASGTGNTWSENLLNVGTAGTWGTSGLYVPLAAVLNWSATPSGGGGDTGLARSAAGVVKVTDGSTGIRGLLGGGTSVASATALPVPTGRVFHVTGTTAITSITSTNFQAGAVITLIFDDVLTFTDGNNLKLAGDFTTSADDTITLAYDGTNWYECSRSVN